MWVILPTHIMLWELLLSAIERFFLLRMPLLLKSSMCHLKSLDRLDTRYIQNLFWCNLSNDQFEQSYVKNPTETTRTILYIRALSLIFDFVTFMNLRNCVSPISKVKCLFLLGKKCQKWIVDIFYVDQWTMQF